MAVHAGLKSGTSTADMRLSTLYPKERPMSCDHIDVITSPSSQKILVYCRYLARELGLSVEDVWWGYASCPDHVENPYYLHMHVTKPFNAIPEFWFTDAQVLGYASDNTTEVIQSEIRQDLEIRLRDDV